MTDRGGVLTLLLTKYIVEEAVPNELHVQGMEDNVQNAVAKKIPAPRTQGFNRYGPSHRSIFSGCIVQSFVQLAVVGESCRSMVVCA